MAVISLSLKKNVNIAFDTILFLQVLEIEQKSFRQF